MPYKTVAELPDAVKTLPKPAQDIYMKAFNSAWEQHKDEEGAEPRSHGIAWAAVKRTYKKDGDRWVAKEAKQPTVEALQAKYSEVVQEAGRRNATLDAARVKKIVELCQELLSSEEPDSDKVGEATTEADSVLAWLKEQQPMKTEDGEKYPLEAFAYTPDSDNPDGWSLRLWESLELKETKGQLGKLAAALSPGGLKGHRAVVAAESIAGVKRQIRASYRRLGVAGDDIPRWVKETMTRDLSRNITPLTEATFDKGRATVVVIKAGFNTDKSRYYPAEMLKQCFGVFEGQKMFADHPTEEEEKALPERSVKSGGWVATLTEVKCDNDGTVTGVAEIIEAWLMQKLALLRDKGMLVEMGISINALGNGSEATIDDTKTLVIEELTGCRSVDFVTYPGAGGNVTLYESDRKNDIDLVELAAFRERRPDLVLAIEADIQAQITEEVKKTMEEKERIVELEGQNETLTSERDGLKTQVEEAAQAQAKASAQAAIKEAVDKAELPEAAKERLVERFKDAITDDGIAEAIQAEVDYIAKLAEAGKVKGMGPTNVDPEKAQKALTESFKQLHPDWPDEKIDLAVKG